MNEMSDAQYFHQLAMKLFQQAKLAGSIKQAEDLRAKGREMEVWAEAIDDADGNLAFQSRGILGSSEMLAKR
jgi:hypothetical protein